LDLLSVTDGGRLEYTIPDVNVSLVNDDKLVCKAGGSVKQQIAINGFSGSLNQQITLKSGSVTLGSSDN